MREALGVQPRAYARYGLALLFPPTSLGNFLILVADSTPRTWEGGVSVVIGIDREAD